MTGHTADLSIMPLPRKSPSKILDLLNDLTRIGAPTFRESRRAEWILSWLRKRGVASCEIDATGNVLADLSGGASRLRLFDAHIDTVFPHETVEIARQAHRWLAPGIFDNTATCVALMTLAGEIVDRNRPVPLLLSFTVAEEGTGNLAGIRAVARTQRARLVDAIVFDLDLESITRVAVGSRRYVLEWQTAGGHSWNDFTSPSALHRGVQWLDRLGGAFPWRKGRHTYNVGTLSGGTGVNVIASRASATLDVRSVDPAFLSAFDQWIRRQKKPGFTSEAIGDRPAGNLPSAHALMRETRAVHRSLGLAVRTPALSTNVNALFEAGIPALSTGIARGGQIHTEDEFLDVDSLDLGMQKLRALTPDA